jgi:hypothetical protein
MKTITVRVGTQAAMFSLQKETLIHRKMAITQMKNVAVLPPPNSFLAWDVEMGLIETDVDLFDEQVFDDEFPISFPEDTMTRESDSRSRNPSGSAQKVAVDPYGSDRRDLRSGRIS